MRLVPFSPHTGSDALDAKNRGGVSTSDAVAGLAYHLNGHNYLDIPGLEINPQSFPRLTMGAWVKVSTGDLNQTAC